MRKGSLQKADDEGEIMTKLNRLLFTVSVFIVMVGIANVDLARSSKRSKIIEETIKTEPEVVAIHYNPLKLIVITRNEQKVDEIAEDEPLLEKIGTYILLSNVIDDPDAENAEQIEGLSLEDPIENIKQGFLSSLEAGLGLKNIRPIEKSQGREFYGVRNWENSYPETPILDFLTTSLAIVPKSPSGDRYLLTYIAKVRLIRPYVSRWRSAKTWSEECLYVGAALRLETFLKEDGALLKDELENAAHKCSERLYSRFVEEISPE